jgi:hypothetical protein
MKTISGKIFTAKVSLERAQEDGMTKVVKEEYACRAVSFTDCEAKMAEQVGTTAGFDVVAEAIAPYKEVYIFDEGATFYKVKITETWADEVTAKEKKSVSYFLVNADSLEQARRNIVEALGGTMTDYTIAAVIEQNILEVFE